MRKISAMYEWSGGTDYRHRVRAHCEDSAWSAGLLSEDLKSFQKFFCFCHIDYS